MSLTGIQDGAAVHMPDGPRAVTQAMTANVGVAASPNHPALSTADLPVEAAVPVAASLITFHPPSKVLSCDVVGKGYVGWRPGWELQV